MYNQEKNKLKKYLGSALYETLKKYDVIIAGGMITSIFTNEKINDIDIYFRSKEKLSDFLKKEMGGYWILCHTNKALTIKYDNEKIVQCIYFKYFNDAEEVFNSFDFTVCMGAYDFQIEEFVLNQNFLKDNSERKLVFNPNTDYPIISAIRLDKYKNKGYSITKIETIRVMLAISAMNISSYKELKDQLGGMYGESFDELFKDKKDENFSLEDAILTLEDFEGEYKKCAEDIEDWEDFVSDILGEPCFVFEFNNKKYKMRGENIIESSMLDVNSKLEDVIKFPITRYKYINQNNASFYDTSFKYTAGEIVNAVGNSVSSGIYCTTKDKLSSASYCGERNKRIAELIIDSPNDIKTIDKVFGYGLIVNKCFVNKIYKEEDFDISTNFQF